MTAAASDPASQFTLAGSNGTDFISGMQQWNAFASTDGTNDAFVTGAQTQQPNWIVTTAWPVATVTYNDSYGHSHTFTEDLSSAPSSVVANSVPLIDYSSTGAQLPNSIGELTMINTNGNYQVNGVTYSSWDPIGPNFAGALTAVGGHEAGHGFGLNDQSASGDIMSLWGATTSNPSGAVNNQDGHAAGSVTSCDANEVKNDPATNAPGSGTAGNNYTPPPPPPTCSQGGTSCQFTNCVPPTCSGSTAWNPEYCECYGYTSPIIIDTDGSGFHLTSASNGVSFDFFGNGSPMQIAWTAHFSTNGWLALDRDGNGTIDDARELFGNITPQPESNNPNGFAALAVFDTPEEGGNGDGIIDAKDAIWPALRVWIDANHDGISQPNELFTLEQVGISAIDLNYTMSRRADQYGNVFRFKGRLVPVAPDGVNRVIYDVVLTNISSTGMLNAAPKVSPWVILNSGILPDEITKMWSHR